MNLATAATSKDQRLKIKKMVSSIKIENFKSIEKIDLKLTRLNILIGENGSGKSNILESIAIAGAAAGNKLDNEFLSSRGIRIISPTSIISAIENEGKIEPTIEISYNVEKRIQPSSLTIKINTKESNYKEWNYSIELSEKTKINTYATGQAIYLVYTGKALQKQVELLNLTHHQRDFFRDMSTRPENPYLPLVARMRELKISKHSQVEILKENMMNSVHNNETEELNRFIIYSPEVSTLRIYEKESQIIPLGINGEGVLKHTKQLLNDEDSHSTLQKAMKLISWFGSFSKENNEAEPYLNLNDKYINDFKLELDQRSTNEGFLFLLFYFVLFISADTPPFFAIDNIDSALNPKLCTELIIQLSSLAVKHNKQVILTTHNPSVLDGIDLDNPEHSLHVVYRNKTGQTNIKEVKSPRPLPGQDPIKLSEAFTKGLIGGLPKNF